jgi:hypothetical protein
LVFYQALHTVWFDLEGRNNFLQHPLQLSISLGCRSVQVDDYLEPFHQQSVGHSLKRVGIAVLSGDVAVSSNQKIEALSKIHIGLDLSSMVGNICLLESSLSFALRQIQESHCGRVVTAAESMKYK